jgi:hypothetical protein
VPSVATGLFQEYADAYARGERPRARDFLDRAGGERDELAALIDRFLASVPVRPASAEDEALVAAWVADEPPLLALRTRRRLRRGEVVDALLAALALDPSRREKLRRRYHELETGQLEPARVDRRVWEALAATLQARAEELAAWGRPARPAAAQEAYFRGGDAIRVPAAAAREAREEEPDEVDRLFGIPGSA